MQKTASQSTVDFAARAVAPFHGPLRVDIEGSWTVPDGTHANVGNWSMLRRNKPGPDSTMYIITNQVTGQSQLQLTMRNNPTVVFVSGMKVDEFRSKFLKAVTNDPIWRIGDDMGRKTRRDAKKMLRDLARDIGSRPSDYAFEQFLDRGF